MDTRKSLGCVGNVYRPFQNVDCFKYLPDLFERHCWIVELPNLLGPAVSYLIL
jgi:hypothetical protein